MFGDEDRADGDPARSAARPALKELAADLLLRAGLSGVSVKVSLALVAVAVIAGVWCVVRWWPGDNGGAAEAVVSTGTAVGATEALSGSGGSSPSGAPSASATESPPVEACVHVVGAVRRPGVYRLPEGARVVDAVDAAGGALATAGLDGIDLAARLQDGQQVRVPTKDEAAKGLGTAVAAGGVPAGTQAAGAAGGGGGNGSGAAPVDLNTATIEQLDALPGIGPTTAQRIVRDRQANGRFASVDDLTRVKGIGPKKLEDLRPFVTAR